MLKRIEYKEKSISAKKNTKQVSRNAGGGGGEGREKEIGKRWRGKECETPSQEKGGADCLPNKLRGSQTEGNYSHRVRQSRGYQGTFL